VRHDGNDAKLEKMASDLAFKIGAGHTFVVVLRDAYPINILNRIKDVEEVASIYCAAANPVEIVVAETGQGRGIIGVVDGFRPKGIENDGDKRERKEFLRKIGYKR